MVRVPMKVDYGVRALVELASSYGERAVQTAEIEANKAYPRPIWINC